MQDAGLGMDRSVPVMRVTIVMTLGYTWMCNCDESAR